MSRILYNCRGSFTNRLLFMQNKPNFLRGQINATLFATKDYENKWQRRVRKNKPKTNPIQTQTNPISEKPKMNLNFYSTKDYDNKPRLRAPGKQTQFKPNSNPICPDTMSVVSNSPSGVARKWPDGVRAVSYYGGHYDDVFIFWKC